MHLQHESVLNFYLDDKLPVTHTHASVHTHSHTHPLVFSSPVILRSNGRVRNSDVKSGVVGGQLLFEDGHVAPKTCQQLREITALQDGRFRPVDRQIYS